MRSKRVDDAQDAAHLRRLNLDRVLTVAMNRPGSFTRADLIEATGLSAPTVGTLLAHLIRKGFVAELGTAPSSGGRRPWLMQFNARHGLVAGIDIGPTHTRLAIADVLGDVVAHRVVQTPHGDTAAALVTSLTDDVRQMMDAAGVSCASLLTVAAGAPGFVDRDRGVVVRLSQNIQVWSQVPMATLIQDALGAPAVIENDVNLAVLGEHWRGAARGHETCAFLTFGTGVGAGVLVNGALHRGVQFAAGEIGRMPMVSQSGVAGSLETLVGAKSLAARWAAAGGTTGDDALPQLFAAARLGDPRARGIVDETVMLMAIATANLNVMFDPSLIVLGGAVIAHNPELVDAVRAVVSRLIPSPCEIVMTALDTEAPLWGSVLVATTEARERVRQQLLEPPPQKPADSV